jgi:hypothetical protein
MTLVVEPPPAHVSQRVTLTRIDWPTVLIVGARGAGYVERLEEEPYRVEIVDTAGAAAGQMAEVMPYVTILSPSVPMHEHRLVHETAIAVGAIVLSIPDGAHPAIVQREVGDAIDRASRKRDAQ